VRGDWAKTAISQKGKKRSKWGKTLMQKKEKKNTDSPKNSGSEENM